MTRKKTMTCFNVETPTGKELAEILAISIVKAMRFKSFPRMIDTHKYVVLMTDKTLSFMNDISFYQNAFSVIPTSELKESIKSGTIGNLILTKAGLKSEYCKKNTRNCGNESN